VRRHSFVRFFVRRFISFSNTRCKPNKIVAGTRNTTIPIMTCWNRELLRRQPGRRLHFQHIERLHLSFPPRVKKLLGQSKGSWKDVGQLRRPSWWWGTGGLQGCRGCFTNPRGLKPDDQQTGMETGNIPLFLKYGGTWEFVVCLTLS
jgi:hypothetical protein